MSLEPQKIKLQEIGMNALGFFVAGIAGGITILILLVILGDLINFSGNMLGSDLEKSGSPLFPIIVSLVTLIGSSLSVFLSTKILSATTAGRYTSNNVTQTQFGIFIVFLYVLMTPIYIWTGMMDPEHILIVFLIHVLLLKLGMSIILEIMNHYRYIIIGVYGSFLGFIISSVVTVQIFASFDTGVAKLISILLLLPLINSSMILCKQLFEFAYYKYYVYSGLDVLGDIFERIEQEEQDRERLEEQENII